MFLIKIQLYIDRIYTKILRILMIKFFIVLVCVISLSARDITPNEVYAQVIVMEQELNSVLDYYGVKVDSRNVRIIRTTLKPRNVWQLTYELSIKMNMLRIQNKLPTIEPVNMEPVLNLNLDLVYEQTQRILTEIRIFKYREGILDENIVVQKYTNKTLVDIFNALSRVSVEFDTINKSGFTPSYVFGETMRIYDDLSTILSHLRIQDNTIPAKRDEKATPRDTFNTSMKILDKIKRIQFSVGIETVDFSSFKNENPTPSDVFTITQMIIAELQTIKAYIGLVHYVTPAATFRTNKTPVDVDQLMNWNMRKIMLLERKGDLR
jgi:hypothetical protein